MGLADSISETNEKAVEIGERYLDTTVKYYKLKLFKHLTTSVSMVMKALLIGGLALIGLLLLSIALSALIGNAIGSYSIGFIIVATIFIVLAGISFYFKDEVTLLVLKNLSKTYFKEENNKKEEMITDQVRNEPVEAQDNTIHNDNIFVENENI